MEKEAIFPDKSMYTRKKKWLCGISLAIVAILAVLLTLFIGNWLRSFSNSEFRDYIQSFGATGWLVFLGLQFLQVFIALIPGELLETAAGFAFGPYVGTILCYAGIALASALVFGLTRRFGVRLVEVFISREKINDLRFLNTQKKRNSVVFLLFFIPGTPKDLFTYFVGLTDMRFGAFLAISLIARAPSILTSTIGGQLLESGNLAAAIWLYGITGIVSIIGLLSYNAYIRRKRTDTNA